jgi:hypothetical protein
VSNPPCLLGRGQLFHANGGARPMSGVSRHFPGGSESAPNKTLSSLSTTLSNGGKAKGSTTKGLAGEADDCGRTTNAACSIRHWQALSAKVGAWPRPTFGRQREQQTADIVAAQQDGRTVDLAKLEEPAAAGSSWRSSATAHTRRTMICLALCIS